MAGLANCLNEDQFRTRTQAFADEFAKTWEMLTQKDRNCIYEVVLEPSLGGVQEACGITGGKVEYAEVYVRGLILAISP
jgi:hypothetical protein